MSLGRLQIGAALVMCSPFIPMLFQGEEFAASSPFLYFTHHEDDGLGKAVSDGRRHEFAAFGWNPEDIPDPQDPKTFARSKIDWSEADREPHSTMLVWYQRLIALRREISILTDGRLDQVCVRFDERERWMTVRRGPIVVAFNLSNGLLNVPIPLEGEIVLSSTPEVNRANGTLRLPADSVAIVQENFAFPEFLKL